MDLKYKWEKKYDTEKNAPLTGVKLQSEVIYAVVRW